MSDAHACAATVHNRRVPAKAGTFQVPAPSDVRGGSCFRRSAEGAICGITPCPRHPRAGGDPGGQAWPCHSALDSRLRGDDGLMRGFAFPLPLMSDAHACGATVHNRRVPAKAGTFQVPAPSDVRRGSCFRRSAEGAICGITPCPRHPRAGGDPRGSARSCHTALDIRTEMGACPNPLPRKGEIATRPSFRGRRGRR